MTWHASWFIYFIIVRQARTLSAGIGSGNSERPCSATKTISVYIATACSATKMTSSTSRRVKDFIISQKTRTSTVDSIRIRVVGAVQTGPATCALSAVRSNTSQASIMT